MARKRTNKIWQINKEEFRNIIISSRSLAEALEKCGLGVAAGEYKFIRKRIAEENVDISHFNPHWANRRRKQGIEPIPLAYILVENSTYSSRQHLKKRLIRQNLLKDICYICGLKNIWQEEPLVLVLDHINGINDDNRLSNLRLLCPNCNSQTDTFAGRNIKNNLDINLCLDCKIKINKKSKRCQSCANRKIKYNKFIIDWPDKDKLLEMIDKDGFLKTGRILGVSDNAVRKHLARVPLLESNFNQ